jgi:PAS domain S-box-containing protein
MKSTFRPFLSQYKSILDSISDGVLAINADMTIIFFNRAAERITKVPRAEAIGRRCFEVMRVEICESACCLKQTMTSGEQCENMPVYIVRADNKRVPIAVTTNVMRDKNGQVIGGVETFRDLSEINQLRQAFRKAHSFENIISKNNKMMDLFTILPQVAESRSSVLIQGDSGTGKELFARAIHNQGPRRAEPFVAINCGALPETLIESELFGYKAGAFTDAKRDKPGRFTLAGEGTIFLDEIGDLAPAMQVHLLRVLENRTYSPLGSTETLEMKARVIAATHRDLEALVARKEFRQDLYFRINVVKLNLPKLADRSEDIPLLVDYFVDRFNTITGKRIAGITDEAMAALVRHRWPGNVRELENALEHAFVLCRSGMIDLPHLPEHVRPSVQPSLGCGVLSLKENERQVVLNALKRNNWRRMATARDLQIDKNTLRRKIQAFGLRPTQA